LNLLCGVLALVVFAQAPASAPPPQVREERGARAVLARLALTGFLGIGYEVLVVRVLSQVTEDTVYTFALLLAVYLVGSAAGAAAYARWLEGRRDPEGLGDGLLAALAAACLGGTASLWAADGVKRWALEAFGAGVAPALGAEALLALVAFGPATV